MSQGKSKTMLFFWGGGGLEAVYYGIVQVENTKYYTMSYN